jgi:hypothetical protein
MFRMTQTIQLQSVGKVPAVPASELKAGDVRMYNFSGTGLVLKVIELTPKTLRLIMFESGKYYVSDIRKDTLVCIIKREQDIKFENEHTFADLKGEKGYVLRYDFAITSEDYEIIGLIEYDGVQHFKPTRFGNMTKNEAHEALIKLKEYDRLKNKYANENNIPLLRISYKKKLNKIYLILNEFIDSLKKFSL